MDPFFLAVSRFNRQRFDECIEICTQMLDKNPYDQVLSPFNLFFVGSMASEMSCFNKKELDRRS